MRSASLLIHIVSMYIKLLILFYVKSKGQRMPLRRLFYKCINLSLTTVTKD